MCGLEYAVIGIGITGPIIGWVILIINSARQRATLDADTANALKSQSIAINEVKDSITDLKRVIGNGGTDGLRGQIHRMQIHCATQTASVTERIKQITSKRG